MEFCSRWKSVQCAKLQVARAQRRLEGEEHSHILPSCSRSLQRCRISCIEVLLLPIALFKTISSMPQIERRRPLHRAPFVYCTFQSLLNCRMRVYRVHLRSHGVLSWCCCVAVLLKFENRKLRFSKLCGSSARALPAWRPSTPRISTFRKERSTKTPSTLRPDSEYSTAQRMHNHRH